MTCGNSSSSIRTSNTLNGPVTLGNCPDQFGCPSGCADFSIRRHDTKPVFKVSVEDCDGPLDLTDLVLEANMWANAKIKAAITANDTYFAFADNVGFEQVLPNDIIIMDRVRRPEHMLVTGIDENNKLIQVQRGYNGTPASDWKKGSKLRIFRMLNSPASIEMIKEDITNVDGTVTKDQLTQSFLVYEWLPEDTCLPGCYWLEFKLLKETEHSMALTNSIDPSTISFVSADISFNCGIGAGVEWVRRFPQISEGFLIHILDSPTVESI